MHCMGSGAESKLVLVHLYWILKIHEWSSQYWYQDITILTITVNRTITILCNRIFISLWDLEVKKNRLEMKYFVLQQCNNNISKLPSQGRVHKLRCYC